MPLRRRSFRLAVLALTAALPASCATPTDPGPLIVAAAPAQIPLSYGSGRPLVELAVRRPDGSERRVWAWVNMGAAAIVLSKDLARDVDLSSGRDLEFRIGAATVTARADAVIDGPGELDGQDLLDLLFAPRRVEIVLPASVLRRFQIVLDPAARTLTLAVPGSLKPAGVPVPIRVEATSGIAVVEARVGDTILPLVLDAGAPYTWLRGSAVGQILRVDPDRHRADGAVGRSNLAMADLGLERSGTLVRLPILAIGDLVVPDVGALGTGPLLGEAGEALLGEVFWTAWQGPAPGAVAGWLGGNVISDFRLTLDYGAGVSYWLRQRPANPRDLDGVGLTLVRRTGGYVVGRVAERNGRRLVPGVEAGDRLIAVDGRPLQGAPPEAAWDALRGPAGAIRHLDLERDGRSLRIEAETVSF